jgi:hypothetical protein
MKITKIKLLKNIDEDKKNLNKFLSENKSATKTFRYFNKREYDVINNHIYTALYFNNDNILGYGHIGKKIMTDLLKNYNGEITLSVDKKNIPAINLYKSKNFIKIEENNNIIIMKLKK